MAYLDRETGRIVSTASGNFAKGSIRRVGTTLLRRNDNDGNNERLRFTNNLGMREKIRNIFRRGGK